MALGLHIDDTTPTLIGPPTTVPMLNIAGVYIGEHRLCYSDETMPTARRKPHNVKLIEIARNIAWGPCANIDAATSVGEFGRQPITIEQEQAHAGFTATYFGRWVTGRGLKGPWSLPVAVTICFGGPVELGTKAQSPPPGVSVPKDIAGGDLRIAA